MPEAGDFVESFEPYTTSTSSRFTPRGKNTGTHRLGGQMCPRLWALWRHKTKITAPARYRTLIASQPVRSLVTILSQPGSTPVIQVLPLHLRWYFSGAEITNQSRKILRCNRPHYTVESGSDSAQQ